MKKPNIVTRHSRMLDALDDLEAKAINLTNVLGNEPKSYAARRHRRELAEAALTYAARVRGLGRSR